MRPQITPARLLALMLPALAAMLSARPAVAQPGDGAPAAITAQEINAYAERLGLTPTQRVAIDPIHDAYKSEFDQLRVQIIEPFLARQRELNMGGPAVGREVVKAMLEDLDRINGRVAQLDDRFFDQITPLLSGPQQAVLPRVRLARERVRLQSDPMMMAFEGSTADLSGMFARGRIRLTPELLLQVDEILIPYEQRLTRRIAELSEVTGGMMLQMLDMMEEAGLLGLTQEEMMADPERMEAVMETAQRAFEEIGRQSREKAADLLEFNVATYRRLLTLLPPRSGAALRTEFLQGGIPFWFGGAADVPSAVWMAAMDIADLPDEVRATIEAELLTAYAGENQLYDTVIDDHVATSASRNPMDFDMDAIDAFQQRTSEVVRALGQRRSEAEARVAALLGEDWRTRRTVSMDDGSAVAGMPGGAGGFAATRNMVVVVEDAEGSSADIDEARMAFEDLLPDRIGGRTLRGMAERIGIAREDRPILEILHEDYREAFTALASIETVEKLAEARWRVREEPNEPSAIEKIRALNTARRAAFGEITGLEERFFDDLAATFGGTPERAAAVERERLARRLARLRHAIRYRNWTIRGGSDAGRVDVAALVHGLEPFSEADRIAAAGPLEAYLSAAIPTGERMLEAVMELQVAEVRWQEEMASAATAGEAAGSVGIGQRYAEVMETASDRLEAIRDELAATARTSVSEIGAVLSAEGRRVLNVAWREAAFPRVYRDRLSVVGRVERALALEDLSGDVRRDLEGMLADYRDEWERLSAEMAEHLEGHQMNMVNRQQVDWSEITEFQRRMSALASERADASIRAANQLRVLLNEGQLARIGGLPDPEDAADAAGGWMF